MSENGCSFDLRVFLEEVLLAYLRQPVEGSNSNDRVIRIITYYIEDFTLLFDISDSSEPHTIVDCLWTYVVEFYGSDSWNEAETRIRQYHFEQSNDPEAEKLNLIDCIETIDDCCCRRL